MTSPAPSGDFLTVALQHALLTADDAIVLSSLVTQRGASMSDVALEEGMLDAVEVDIVTMLQNAHDAVPGYEILGLLGRGGMGVVFRARQKNLDREVALKTLLLSQLSQREALARFQREARTIGQLQHPNIVSVYDFDKHQGRLYLAMELIPGHDLGHQIQRQKTIDERKAWLIARQVAAGLAFANRAGIVHRDIKPANILVVRDSEHVALAGGAPLVKISDFGLSRLVEDGAEARLTQTGRVVGTPNFMAPEQLTGEPLDCRTDIYALGGTVYNMLTGHPPYESQNVSQLMARKLSEGPPDVRAHVPQVSAAGAQLITAMMQREPAKRIGNYDTLLAEIDQVLAALNPSHAVAQKIGASLVKQQAPSAGEQWTRWLFISMIGIAVLLLGISGFLAWQRNSRPPAPTLVQGEWSEPLFNGESVAGWRPEPGSTVSPERDFEGGRVLGLSGAATRSWTLPPHVTNYRLTIAVVLHEAKSVEIQFAGDEAGQPRYTVVLDSQSAELQTAGSKRRKLGSISLLQDGGAPSERRISLRIERQGSHWWIYVDGQPVGYAAAAATEQSALRIHTNGGQALLDEVRVEELVAP